ncbi:universal stress protein [Catellatospora sp. IY07-71]|uniref:universal stress protein n=1 Tax=Catellatospora sp. IY07-71 TaxID=2728827 RepID=UPI001BB37868|nr:universal stress protein [Catellatospora sp. IY07-71]BCJ75830.1 universal stress protein [Catellatospora sp. IY07-71]
MDPDTATSRPPGRGHPVVAGVDGSPASLQAARYAALLARERGSRLELVCGYQSPLYGFAQPWLGQDFLDADQQAVQDAAEQALASAAAELRAACPELDVVTRLRVGGGAYVLIEESRRAALVVVGARGAGGFARLLLGSVSAQVAAHAHASVVVTRPDTSGADPADAAAAFPAQQLAGPVLVGYDGSDTAQAALGFAASEALLRRARLVMVNVHWQEPWGFGPKPVTDPEQLARADAEQMLAEAIAPWRARHAELDVELRPVHSLNAERSMIEQSGTAALTVVGCRGRGGFTGKLLGSVSHALVEHGHGPVAVVHR